MKINNYKQAAASVAFLTLLLTAGIYPFGVKQVRATVSTTRQRGDSAEQQKQILEAFEQGDYQAWKNLVASNGVLEQVITQADFDQFILARNMVRSGQYEASLPISSDLAERLKVKLG
jgi:hypothetical protein